jgi:hypothetical protein
MLATRPADAVSPYRRGQLFRISPSPFAAADLQYFDDLDDPGAMRHRFHPRRVDTVRDHRAEQMKLSQKQVFAEPPQSR